MRFFAPIPILRSFGEGKARELWDQERGTREMTVQDGSGNKLAFHRSIKE